MHYEKLPYIELKGTPRQIGLAHGEVLRGRIHQTYDYYRALVPGVGKEELQSLALQYAWRIRAFQPRYAEEIEAIAHAASIADWKIFLLNSRTELIRQLKPPTECTTAYFRDARLLGENWDWSEDLERLFVLVSIEQESGHRILMMTEPGIIGKIGMNAAGVGVCLNILRCPRPLGGIPIHVLLRAVLDQTTVSDALQELSRAPLGTMSNMIIGDAEGSGLDVEIAGTEFSVFGENDRFVLHTNHYLGMPIVNNREEFESSYHRYERARELLNGARRLDFSAMRALLSDTAGGQFAICSRYCADEIIGSVGTVCSIIMDLARRQMHITPGNPLNHDFRTYSV